jgi:ketosteroid isomerase-like protein
MDTELAKLVFNQTVEKYHRALGEFNKGNAQPVLEIFSMEDDISLASPLGSAVKGRKNVVETATRVASDLRDGESTGFENLTKFVSCDFAYIVENEHYRAKVAAKPEFDLITLRVTSIFRMEDGGWKMVHRHADPIISEKPVEMMIQKIGNS